MKKRIVSILLALVLCLSLLPTSVLADELPDASITVPIGAALFVGTKGQAGGKDTHFVAFAEVQATKSVPNEANGTTTYYFELTNGKVYNYRVSGPDYVTYTGIFTKSADFSMEITEAMLQPVGKTKTTVDRDPASNGGFNMADVFLNINAQGYLKLAGVGSTYQLVNIRNWQTVDSTTNNYFIEPDFHYAVIDENGSASSSVVTVSDSGLITAVGAGTAIVLVTYDAMNNASATGGPFFGAIWPENTGVFVVSVGAGESGIATGMTINEGRNTDASTQKMALDALDAELDVIYFTGSSGSYTFKPATEGCTVSVANPTVTDKLAYSGFVSATKNADNSFTVPLAEGRNIVKLEKSGGAEYQVITAKHVSYTVNDGIPVIPGDTVKIVFDTLYHPANKLAGVYNMSALGIYSDVQGYEGKLIGTSSAQYNYASNAAAQTVAGGITKKTTSFGVQYSADKKTVLTVPADHQGAVFSLKDGYFVATGYGDPFGNHRGITLTDGKAPNLNASMREGIMGRLPDISIPVTALESLSVTTQPSRTSYCIGDSFDPAGMVVEAVYTGGVQVEVSNYTFSEAAFSATGQQQVEISYTQGNTTKTAQVSVTVGEAELDHIAITAPPAKTAYQVNENFDAAGMVVTAYYSDGSSAPITRYTLSHGKLISTDSAVTVSYNGKTAQQAVSVTGKALSNIAITTKPTKMNYKVGEILDPTGLVVTATYNDSTKAVVTGSVTFDGTAFSTVSSSKSVKVSYTEGGVTKTANITGIKVTEADPVAQPPETVTVYFTLLGDSTHDSDSDGQVHTLRANNLTTWIDRTTITVESGAMVIDVVAKALGSAGIPYSNPSGNYISSIRGLAEFTNGNLSGWMYTLNGTHAKLGVAEQTVKNGDAIVVHYTDDYTQEQGGEQWGGGTAEKKAETHAAGIAPEVTVKNGEAIVSVDSKAISDAITAAKADGAKEIVIAPETKGDASKVSVELPKAAVKDIAANSDAALNIQTGVGSIDIPNDTLSEIVKAAGSTDIAISAELLEPAAVKASLPTGAKLENAVAVEFSITSGDKAITSFGGKALKVSIPIDAKKFVEGKTYTAFVVSADGTVETTTAKIVSGEAVVEMRHFSTVAITNRAVTVTFTDVAADTYYYDAVLWAATKGVTSGTDDTHFSPDSSCTRAQVVTFLWRAALCPKAGGKTPFTDVAADTYYSDAVAWAYEQNITGGTSATTFSPNTAVTRAQVVTFLYRYEKPAAGTAVNPFADVQKNAYYYDAVLWAYANGITDGTDGTHFSPNAACTRGQIVTFLYRDFDSELSERSSGVEMRLAEAAAYVLKTTPAPRFGSVGGEWAVLGLARSGSAVPHAYYADYYAALEKTVSDAKGVLSTRKYTEYSRVIVALAAIGKDARDVAGYDLTMPLGDYDNTIRQGTGGSVWALIALDSRNYPMPICPDAATSATRQMYIDRLLATQNTDGGWGIGAESASDIDMTAMALQALAKYQEQKAAADATERALAFLGGKQDENGGYASSESTAQVIVALCSLGIDLGDIRFIKNGHTLLDDLESYRVSGGGYRHTRDGEVNQMASEQALYALAAVQRAQTGMPGLYRMEQ